MKNSKSRNSDENRDYEDDEYGNGKKKFSPRRRPVRNWTKAWSEHEKDYGELDDFYGK